MNMQIKTIVILWTLVMILGSCSSDSDDGTKLKSKFKGGDGSKENPYQIETKEQLILVEENLKSHFKMVKDIDLKGEDFKPIGVPIVGGVLIKALQGTFDGGGKKIKNLKINRPTEDHVGLFRVIGETAVVKNIGLENVDVKGKTSVGGLAGTVQPGGKIENSYVTGKVIGESRIIGGLAGWNKGRIENSYATASVSTKDNNGAGGLVGRNEGKDALIENSYATGSVEGKEGIGGLVGINYNGSELKNSYATGKVTGSTASSTIGGLLGTNGTETGEPGGIISGKSYWKKGTTAKGVGFSKVTAKNVEEKTEAELKALTASDTKWDTAIWDFKAGEYPKLKPVSFKPQAF